MREGKTICTQGDVGLQMTKCTIHWELWGKVNVYMTLVLRVGLIEKDVCSQGATLNCSSTALECLKHQVPVRLQLEPEIRSPPRLIALCGVRSEL